MAHAHDQGKRYQHLHQTGVVIMIDVASINCAMRRRSIDPEEFALRGQGLSQGVKGIEHPENNQYDSKILLIIFFPDAFRRNQEHYPIRKILKCSIFRHITVGGSVQNNLGKKKYEKDQGWQIKRILRQRELPGYELLSRPNKKQNRRSGFEDESGPLFDSAKRQNGENQNTAQS